MLEEFRHFIEVHKLVSPGQVILLAVSGGVDSMVMEELFHRSGFDYAIAHCNFNLRGSESEAEEKLVRNLAARRNVPFHLAGFATREHARKKKISLQMAARELRYAWFQELREIHGYASTATAHHLDDQAETFLINLTRGTGIAGLHGILPATEGLIRPMLFTGRKEIAEFALREKVNYLEDSSNLEEKYRRNLIRHRIIPAFERMNPAFTGELSATIERIRDIEQIYLSLLDEKRERMVREDNGQTRIPIRGLKELSPLPAWFFELLKPFGFSQATVRSIISAMDGQPGKSFSSATHRLVIDRDEIIIQSHPSGLPKDQYLLPLVGREGRWEGPVAISWKKIPAKGFRIPDSSLTACLDLSMITGPLTIRRWKKGDYFYPLGMGGRKKLSDFFVDRRLSVLDKQSVFLLCQGEDIVWIIGHRIDDRFRVKPSTRQVLYLECPKRPS